MERPIRAKLGSLDGGALTLSHEKAYAEYRPLLLAGLGRLARQGYPVPPGEGLELVHAFLAEEFPGLAARYVPGRAAFSTYVFAAFIRYARPRIVRSLRWEKSLAPDADLEALVEAGEGPGTPDPEVAHDVAAVQRALAQLPAGERVVLEARFVKDESERETAKRLGVSRYRLRESFARALASVAARLDGPEAGGRWQVARSLWSEERSAEDVAGRLGVDVEAVARARRKAVAMVGRAVARKRKPRRQGAVAADGSLCELWTRFVAHPGEVSLVTEVRARREALVEHLEECEPCGKRLPAPGLLPDVYLALAGDHPSPDEAELETLLTANRSAHASALAAVRDALLPGLPDVLQTATFGRRDEDDRARLLFEALDSVALYLHGLARDHDAGSGIELRDDGAIRLGTLAVPAADLEDQLARHTGEPPEVVAALLRWIVEAARSQPAAIPGLVRVGATAKGLTLEVREDPSALELNAWWAPRPASRPGGAPMVTES